MKVQSVLRAIATHHAETYRHLHAVHDACYALARVLNYGPGHAEAIATAGLLHDIGKLYIPRDILDAPRKLTSDEWEIVRKHPVTAREILTHETDPRIAEFVALHHERTDGSGYPYGLLAEDIPREALVLAAVDVWDALSSCRPYVATRSIEERVALFLGEKHRIGPDIVQAHLSLFGNDPAPLEALSDPALVDEVAS